MREFVRLHRPFFIVLALVLISYGAAQAYGSWFQMQDPPGCSTVTSIAVDATRIYAACDDGRIYYREKP